MMLERYVAKVLPRLPGEPEFRTPWWGILDCELDEFVEVEGAGGYKKTPMRFSNPESARYGARKRNMGLTWGDA